MYQICNVGNRLGLTDNQLKKGSWILALYNGNCSMVIISTKMGGYRNTYKEWIVKMEDLAEMAKLVYLMAKLIYLTKNTFKTEWKPLWTFC